MKHFDPINGPIEWRGDLPLGEMAKRAIRTIRRRLSNPSLAADVRATNLAELKRQRLLLMRLGKS